MTNEVTASARRPCENASVAIGSTSCAWIWSSGRASFDVSVVRDRRAAHARDRHRREYGDLRRAASVLLRPLPYPQPEQLVQIWSDHRAIGRAQPEWLTPPDFIDFRDGNSTFASMAAYQGWGPDLTGSGDPQTVSGLLVTGRFFDVLQSKPAIGR